MIRSLAIGFAHALAYLLLTIAGALWLCEGA